MNGADFPAGAALVIGGSGGIGRAVCEQLARRGADVALTYRSNAGAAAEAAEAVEGAGRAASIHQLDMRDAAAIDRVVADVASRHAAIHTLVYGAGPNVPQTYIGEIDPAVWRETVDADLHGFFGVARAALPHLRDASGALVAITSAAVHRYTTRDMLSAAPKAAVEQLVRGIAREEGRYGVRANAVALGVIEAGMFLRLRGDELDETWLAAARQNIALRRFGAAAEVAEAVAFLASARASYITGQTILLDGGYSI